jgi:hypothetical protein
LGFQVSRGKDALEGAKMDIKNSFSVGLVVLAGICLSGCDSGEPRMRMGAFFGSPGGMSYPDMEHLGKHNHRFASGEKEGLVYTSSGGFIDIGHVREAADRAAYAAHISYDNLMAGHTDFTCRLIEPSIYCVSISYPANWQNLPPAERQRIARDVSIPMGQYIAHKSLIWHEIITWFGFASTGIFSEKISSFSFEDTYSDATGIALGGQALRDSRPYDEAMTDLLTRKLNELGVQTPQTARHAVKQIDGRWYKGNWYFFVEMKEPSFDVGFERGNILPRLVPGICPQARAQPCPVPALDEVTRRGFWVTLEIDPRIWEQGKIFRIVHIKDNSEMLRPEVHFPEIIDELEHETR